MTDQQSDPCDSQVHGQGHGSGDNSGLNSGHNSCFNSGHSTAALLRRRLIGATAYSMQGLKACFQHEEAFRIEVIASVVLLPLALLIGDSAVERLLLIGSVVIVLIVELLNSAVEAAVDRVSEEHHELAGRAKDLGSAAVLLAVGLFLLTWIFILLS